MLFSKQTKKDVMTFPVLGIGLGVSQSLTTTDLSPLSSKLPVMGNIVGSGMVLEQLSNLNKKVKNFK